VVVVGVLVERRRWRKKKPRAGKRINPAMQPMTIPAIAPPERPLDDDEEAAAAAAEEVEVLEARKTVVVGPGVVDADIVLDEEEV
jgi:hypothetical protein